MKANAPEEYLQELRSETYQN